MGVTLITFNNQFGEVKMKLYTVDTVEEGTLEFYCNESDAAFGIMPVTLVESSGTCDEVRIKGNISISLFNRATLVAQ